MHAIQPVLGFLAALWILSLPATEVRAGSGSRDALRTEIESFVRSRSGAPPERIQVPPLSDFALPGIAASRIETEKAVRATLPPVTMRAANLVRQ